MTITAEPTAAAQVKTRVDSWLSDFEQALTAGDVERATELFAPECFWRDLVAFTWNITTVEGRAGVADLLRNTLETTKPTGWRTSEPPEEADGGHHGVGRVRDGGGPRQRAAAAH